MGLRRFDVCSLAGGRTLGIALLCATLLLTACGGNNKKSTPTPTKPAATVAAPTTASGSAKNASPTAGATKASGSTSGNVTPSTEPTIDITALASTETAAEATFRAQATTMASFTGSIDACKLVSRSDAEKIIGKLSGDPFHGTPGLENAKFICNYNPAAVPGTAVVEGQTVVLAALSKDDLAALGMTGDVKTEFAKSKADAKTNAGYTDVSGIGDDAYYTTDSGLNVIKGDKGISVSGLPLDKAKDFAKKALDNL
jgi:hypothetical protein